MEIYMYILVPDTLEYTYNINFCSSSFFCIIKLT